MKKAIKHNLITIIVFACIAGGAFIGLERRTFRNNMVQNVSRLAEVMAENSIAALAFEDKEDAENVLKALHVDSSIISGSVYDSKNELFATYYRDKNKSQITPTEFKTKFTFSDDFLIVSTPIVLHNEIIGTLCLRSDLSSMYTIESRDFDNVLKAAEQGDAKEQYALGLMYYDGGVFRKQDYSKAIKWFRKSAEQGNADAQSKLGWMYAGGEGVAKDYNESLKWYRKAAEQGDAFAQSKLGWMYAGGEGVAKDYNESLKWCRKAAEQGHPRAQCVLGVMYDYGKGVTQDDNEAVKWYSKAAEQGHPGAQCLLGVMYDNGDGVTKDYNEAAKWYRKAAEQGDAGGQGMLGSSYYEGKGVTQDYREAIKWFKKAAEQGDTIAQSALGEIYADGKGVAQDYIEAYKWTILAAEQGDPNAVEERDALKNKMSPQQIAEAQRLAKELRPKIDNGATLKKGETK